ncbi:unnamed protein product [Clonostachys rosea f. rosea IK726]|uniref:Uncharacterized protein n=1 Tax=Clonostachys rosea f. rosea IK726 TaxID=1349383 RepID=A0ACA9U0V3_BIOOC|nr:unnamed protein product [Clonostachys rosea f. rosea IK726]
MPDPWARCLMVPRQELPTRNTYTFENGPRSDTVVEPRQLLQAAPFLSYISLSQFHRIGIRFSNAIFFLSTRTQNVYNSIRERIASIERLLNLTVGAASRYGDRLPFAMVVAVAAAAAVVVA